MRRKTLIVATCCCLLIACAIVKLRSRTTVDGASPSIETRVSESRQDGKHQRTTEIFRDKILLSRKQEVRTDDGKLKYVFTKLFREGEMVFFSCFYAQAKRTIRGYYYQDKLVLEEGDEDGDGFFETMILFDAKEQPVEAFSKSKDGTVTLFSKEKLAELKKSFSKFQE